MSKPTTKSSLSVLCRWALRYAFRRWIPLAAVLTTMLMDTGLNVLKPLPMVFLVDLLHARVDGHPMHAWVSRVAEFLPGSPTITQLVGWSVAATVLIFMLGWLVSLANAYANVSLGQRMVYDLASDLFAKLQLLSLRFHTSQSVGNNIRRVTADCACVSVIVKDALLPVLASLVTVVAMFNVLWQIDTKLALIVVATVPYMLVIFRFHARPMMNLSYAEQQMEGRIYEVAEQTLSAMPAVQAFGREDFNNRRFKQATDQTLAATLKLTKVQLSFSVLIGLATAVGTAAIMWLGGQHALTVDASSGAAATPGVDPLAAIVAALSYLGLLYKPLSTVAYTSSTVQTAAGSAQRVREILDAEREVTDKPGAPKLASVQGRVQIENVTFGYDASRPVLHNISLSAEPGETIALVGATGAGKSTLAGLIPRFFDPQTGRVLVDGQDVRDVQLKSLRRHIAFVLQEPFLFPLSVAENIAYGRAHATPAEIEAAAHAANAHNFITRLPEGYHTVIGERGATLSGGERQRLSIARALLKNAPILILDEPTSALDVETEHSLLEALERLTQGRTTFIIAHRLSTIRRASRIVVLQSGAVVESGTHQELLARGGKYAEFHHLQSGR